MRDIDDSNVDDEIPKDEEVKEEKDLGEEDEVSKTLEEAQELTEILDSWNEFHQMTNNNKDYSYNREDDDGALYEKYLRAPEDKMAEYLLQLYSYPMSEDEYDFATYLIDSVDQYGFLRDEGFIKEVAEIY